MKKERLEEIFERIEFKTEIDKELLFTYLKEYATDVFLENTDDFIVIDDGESYLYFRNPFTGSFYNLSITEFMKDLKRLYNAKDYDEVITIMDRVEFICDYIYEDLCKKLIEEE